MTLPSSGGDTHRYSGWLPAASNWQPRHRPQASPVASTCSHSRLRIHASANATLPMPAGPVSSRACGRRPLRRRAHCSFCHGSNLPDKTTKHTKNQTQLRLHLVEGARGVDQPKSRGLALGPPQICRPHALEKHKLLTHKTIELAAASADAGATQLRRRVQQQGEVGTKLALHPGLELRDTCRGATAAAALIGISRVGEAVAHHPLTLGQCGANDLSEVLRARGEHEQQLRVHTHALGTAIQQDGADAFAEGRTTGFAGHPHRLACRGKTLAHERKVKQLAYPLAAFHGNEHTAH